MKKVALPLLLALGSGLSVAQEVGRVISTTPVIQQIGVPRQVCTTQQVTNPGMKSGAGAAMGAIAGGAIGNNIGDGAGRAVATMLGLVGGAILGDRLEGAPAAQVQNVQSCSTQTFYENRTVSYNVVYEFNGKQYTMSMPQDPGQFVKLQVTPISAVTPAPAPMATYVPPAITAQEIVGVDRATYAKAQRHYHTRPYYPPVGVYPQWGYPSDSHPRHWR